MKINQSQKNIPSGWRIVSLESLSLKISDGIHTTPKYSNDSKYYFINGNNLFNYKVNIFAETKKVDYSEYLKHKRDLDKKNTILLSINGTIGTVAYYNDEQVVLGKSCAYIKLNSSVNPNFIFYYLNSNGTQKYFISELAGSTIQNLSLKSIKSSPVKLPSLPEQNRIVSVLETWDKATEKLSKKIELKKQIKKGLMQDLLTGKKRLKGFNDKWSTESLGDLEDSGKIKLGRGEVISKIDIENDPGDNPIYSSSVQKNGLFGKYAKYMFDEELISWSVDGGGHFFYRPKHKFSITNVSGWMRVDTKIFNYKFLASLLQLSHSRKYFDYQFKAHPSVIRDEYIITYPNIEEQSAIAQILTTADREINTLENKLKILKEQKRYLLNNLITGTIRTPETLSTKLTK